MGQTQPQPQHTCPEPLPHKMHTTYESYVRDECRHLIAHHGGLLGQCSRKLSQTPLHHIYREHCQSGKNQSSECLKFYEYMSQFQNQNQNKQ